MSELGRERDEVQEESPAVPAYLKGNCLSFGHCFAPGTTVKRLSDGKEFTLIGVMSSWWLDGEVSYLGHAEDREQTWVIEAALMTADSGWDLVNEVNANDLSERRAGE